MNRTDAMRNLLGILNRYKNPTAQNVATIQNLVSPPYKGETPNPIEHTYPECLSGLHDKNKEQKIVISGDTCGNNSQVS